eukprot:CAMPEP_0173463738 /NCGR_PEP_ID=MMETSP1357-20121228/68794_1 /TAXON_ID=77926 /ORGANISM="Hemiselmis rufescens, Strain PCC563" /LENGTH=63 /DNA_ID=CAMNT_0014431577 /DNA_START=274 /DNA_END=462 /DNA_ORIENTATION=+
MYEPHNSSAIKFPFHSDLIPSSFATVLIVLRIPRYFRPAPPTASPCPTTWSWSLILTTSRGAT